MPQASAKAQELNRVLRRTWPAAERCLSPLGRSVAFPRGIPAQAAEAGACRWKATIGEFAGDDGQPLVLPAMAAALAGLDRRLVFPYSPQGGLPELRQAWRDHILAGAGEGAPVASPFTTLGLTHAISIAADLFVGPGDTALLPEPCWGNYSAILGTLHGARLATWRFFDPQGRLDVASFRRALSALPEGGLVVVNLPGNPTGYAPSPAEASEIARAILAHPRPATVLFDDAYQGLVHEPDVERSSLFWRVAARADPARLVPLKVDGSTKELCFFGGRVGFLTLPFPGPGAEALLDKATAIVRATISCPPAPTQAAVLAALRNPDLERQLAAVRSLLAGRYRALKAALAGFDGPLRPLPFNAGCFALLAAPDLDVEDLRRRLLRDWSVGVVALPRASAIRLAYAAISAEQIPELVARLRAALP